MVISNKQTAKIHHALNVVHLNSMHVCQVGQSFIAGKDILYYFWLILNVPLGGKPDSVSIIRPCGLKDLIFKPDI